MRGRHVLPRGRQPREQYDQRRGDRHRRGPPDRESDQGRADRI